MPPPGVGLNTVTVAVPTVATSEAGTEAVIEVALTNVVVSGIPFQFTTEVLTKLVPISMSVKAELPAPAELGASEVSVGEGLLIVKVCADDVPPLGAALKTVTMALPARAMSEAGTVAVTEVPLTNVVTSGTPFQSTTVPLT